MCNTIIFPIGVTRVSKLQHGMNNFCELEFGLFSFLDIFIAFFFLLISNDIFQCISLLVNVKKCVVVVISFLQCDVFSVCLDDLQDLFKRNADKRRETAVHGLLETTQLGLSSETRVEKENL